MPDAPRLRRACVEDAAEIARLAGELGYPAEAQTMVARLAALLPQPQQHVMVAQAADGTLLGWIAVERRLTLESGERIEIVGLVVDAAARGGGIGHVLVSDAEHWARQQGFDAISVRSNVTRLQSHPFYLRLGYVHRKTQHAYIKSLDAVG
jgi:GNAT superfamily N-acetyltransferase